MSNFSAFLAISPHSSSISLWRNFSTANTNAVAHSLKPSYIPVNIRCCETKANALHLLWFHSILCCTFSGAAFFRSSNGTPSREANVSFSCHAPATSWVNKIVSSFCFSSCDRTRITFGAFFGFSTARNTGRGADVFFLSVGGDFFTSASGFVDPKLDNAGCHSGGRFANYGT